MVKNKHSIVMEKKFDKWNEFIEKTIIFMKNIPITFEIFRVQIFTFFQKKG